MLFFFGWKSTGLNSFPVESTCEHCNQSGQRVHVFQKYFHIFWIPTIPIGKQTVLECMHCKKAILEKEMSPTQRHLSLPKRNVAKTPAYTFTGLVLIACLIGWGKYTLNQEDAKTQALISSPAVNDLVAIKVSKNQIQILKLSSIKGNKIRLQPGNYLYNNQLSAYRAILRKEIDEKDYFSDVHLEVTKEKYKEINIEFVERENLSEKL